MFHKHILIDTDKLNNIPTIFLIFRTLFYIVMEFPKEEEEGFGRVLENNIMNYLGRDSGKGRVILIRIPIINISFAF